MDISKDIGPKPKSRPQIGKSSSQALRQFGFTTLHGSHSSRSPRHRVFWSSVASIYDALLICGASLVALSLGSIVLKTSFRQLFQVCLESRELEFVAVLIAFSFIYCLGARMTMGCTLGEWSCHLQLGKPSDQQKPSYPLRVCARYLLVLFSGVILIPVVSMITNCDLAGKWSGLKLCEDKN